MHGHKLNAAIICDTLPVQNSDNRRRGGGGEPGGDGGRRGSPGSGLQD